MTPGPFEACGPMSLRDGLRLHLIVTNYPPAIAACGFGYAYTEANAEGIALFCSAMPEIIAVLRAAQEALEKFGLVYSNEGECDTCGAPPEDAHSDDCLYAPLNDVSDALAALESKVAG